MALFLLVQGGTLGCRTTTEILSHFRPLPNANSPVLVNKTDLDSNKPTISSITPKSESDALMIAHIIHSDKMKDIPARQTIVRDAVSETDDTCIAVNETFDQIAVIPGTWAKGAPIRFVATTHRAAGKLLKLVVKRSNGEPVLPERSEKWGTIPRAIGAYFAQLSPDIYTATLVDANGKRLACQQLEISDSAPLATPPETGVWTLRSDWTPAMEDLYSVFVAKLFYVRPGGQKGWRPLHQATRDPFRNILYNSFGLDEDNPKSESHVILEPDCADAPFQLRAYFAWKMGLPYMFNQCRRGSSLTGPKCYTTYGMLTTRFDDIPDPVARFNRFASTYVSWKIHAGNGRTHPSSDTGDVYPASLSIDAIRPGAIFVDAGGHLILVSQVELQKESRIGVVYGVDAHPDRTVTHKQFSIGTFVFNHRVPTDGFKLFRPVVRNKDQLRFLSNSELTEKGFIPWSDAQSIIDTRDVFYQKVGKLLNPVPLDPKVVLSNKVAILHKALQERVEAVAIGVAYMKNNNWQKMTMPNGPAIFQTDGPWEIYSTPARDMRVFLAIDDVMTFPKRVADDTSQYIIDQNMTENEIIAMLKSHRDEALKALTITYERGDGSLFELNLSEVIKRQEALEMAYNPNDCIEIRWGAPKDSEEMSTCTRKAPPDQRYKMKLARRWFASRRRPDQR